MSCSLALSLSLLLREPLFALMLATEFAEIVSLAG